MHYGAYAMWDLGWVVSYRVLQYDLTAWIGQPSERPAIAAGITPEDSNMIYASWNGATVVRTWRLQGAERWSAELDSDVGGWESVNEMPKEGFEVAFELPDATKHGHHGSRFRRRMMLDNRRRKIYRYYRVQAVGHDGQILSSSRPVDSNTKELVSSVL